MTVSEWKGKSTIPVDLMWWLSRLTVAENDDVVCGLHKNFLLMMHPVYESKLVAEGSCSFRFDHGKWLRNEFYLILSDDPFCHHSYIDGDQFNRYLNLSSVECLI